MNVQDPVIAAVAITSPWWVAYFEGAYNILMMSGVLALLALRLAISWVEWKNRKK